jgi:DivIVA domain-containing protein
MGQLLLLLVVALTVAAVVFGVTVLVTGADPGLAPVEPDGKAVPLPSGRPLDESDLGKVRFDTALRGYRMAQVDEVLRRAAYDIGYKSELVGVLEAEVAALRDGRVEAADELRRTRQAAVEAAGQPTVTGAEAPQATDAAPGTRADADADTGSGIDADADTVTRVDTDAAPGARAAAGIGQPDPVDAGSSGSAAATPPADPATAPTQPDAAARSPERA